MSEDRISSALSFPSGPRAPRGAAVPAVRPIGGTRLALPDIMSSRPVLAPLALCVALLAPGCARTVPAVTRPSEMYSLKEGTDGYAITYDARGRGAYLARATTETSTKNGVEETRKKTGLVFCAEPPPDAAANLNANREVNAAVDAMVKLKAVEVAAKGSGGSKDSASSEIANVATRTELVLLMRDALYRVCEMNANGVLSDQKAEQVFGNVLATARMLGQRDNVGKLIDVLAIVASAKGDKDLSPQLVESLVATIRLIALGDQLIQTEGGAEGLTAALVTTVMLADVAKISDVETRKAFQAIILEQIKRLKQKKTGRATKEDKDIDAGIETLKSVGVLMGIAPESLE